jgi:hypothetical protein
MLKYTKQLPTKNGFYWHRRYRYKSESVLQLCGGRIVGSAYFPEAGKGGPYTPADLGGEWAGPIPWPGANCEPCIEEEATYPFVAVI